MAVVRSCFTTAFGNEPGTSELSPRSPHDFVDILWMKNDVGTSQRREIKQWRGLQRGAFGYNEGPTSSCHTFCWKARHYFDVPFFYVRPGPLGTLIAPRLRALKRNDILVVTFD